MPLFGSNFAQGFATGFAKSASKSIDNAIAQRDADVSAAKKFAMTRAAQLEEQALEKDKRTQNAIDKMAARFTKGGETDWNRVYGAIMATDGGDLDSLDALFENMKKTEEQGIKFDINDVFKYAEGDESLSNLSRDDIFQALRAEYEAPTVRATDTTFLSKVGLGAGETGGQRADEQVRGLFPGATRTAVEGDYGTTTLDQGALAAAVEYGMKVKEFEKNMTPSLAEAFADVTSRIGKLDPESPTFEQDKAKLEEEYLRAEKNLQAYTRATTEETTTPGSMTAGGYAKIIMDGRKSALELAGLGDNAAFVTIDGVPVSAADPNFADAIKIARKKVIDDYNERQVRSQMNPDGTLSFLGQQIIGTDVGMGEIYQRIVQSKSGTDTSVGADTDTGTITSAATQTDDIFTSQPTEGSDTSTQGFTPESAAKQLKIQYPTAKDLINSPKGISQIKQDPAKMFDKVRKLYPDVPPQTIQDIINEQLVLLEQQQEEKGVTPSFTYRTPKQIKGDEERAKVAEETVVLSDFAGGGAQVNE